MTADPKALFAEAMAELNQGRFGPARQKLRTLNGLAPGNPDILSFLGFAEASMNLAEGLDKTGEAADLAPDNPQILMNHAFALARAGKTGDAIKVLQRANDLAPDQVPVLNQLTKLLVAEGDLAGAGPLTAALTRLAPGEEVFAYRHLKVLIGLEKAAEAREFAQSLEKVFPPGRFLTEMQARAARAAEDWTLAYKLYRALCAEDPGNVTYKRGLAHALLGLEDFGQVIPILKEIRTCEPDNDQVVYSMAFALFNDNRHEECLPFVEKVLEKEPDHVDALIIKGQSLVFFGEFEEAQEIFNRVLELSPDHPMAVMQLTKVRRPKVRDDSFDQLEAMEKTARDEKDYRALMNYTLGEMYERIGDYDTAFARYKRGNDLAKAAYAKRGFVFDRGETLREFDRIKTLYSKENLLAMKGAGDPSTVPIFIVAMPRSGTTLLEQVVSSHSRVFGAGELPLGNGAAKKLLDDLKKPTPKTIRDKLTRDAQSYARVYLEHLPRGEKGEPRVSDKMPGNFRNLGFLQTVLPEAGYIVIRRNPLDVCLSMYKGFFNKGFTYALDLEDLGFYYRQFHELMAFWEKALPRPVLTIRYEDFVAHPEGQARRVLDHLGLDWEPGCLEFYKRRNKVITMSTMQVREPVHGNAVDKWRRFEEHLEPLIRGLGPDIMKTLDV